MKRILTMLFNDAKPRLIGRWFRKPSPTPHELLQSAMKEQAEPGKGKKMKYENQKTDGRKRHSTRLKSIAMKA